MVIAGSEEDISYPHSSSSRSRSVSSSNTSSSCSGGGIMSSMSASIAISDKVRSSGHSSSSKITTGISSSLPSSLRDSFGDRLTGAGFLMNSFEKRRDWDEHSHEQTRKLEEVNKSNNHSSALEKQAEIPPGVGMELDGKVADGSSKSAIDTTSSRVVEPSNKSNSGDVGCKVGYVNHHGVVVMDLSNDTSIISSNSRYKRYSFSPPEGCDLTPHLSELDHNVMAILSRCDPQRVRRCYSCGYDNTEKFEQQHNSFRIESGNYGYRNSGYESWNPAYGYSNPSYGSQRQEPLGSWNNYNDYNTGYFGGGNQPGGSYYNQNYQGMVNTSVDNDLDAANRRRLNSDGALSNDSDLVNAMDEDEVFTFDARLLSEAFLSSGRIDHSIQLMAFHPNYLEIFLKTHHFLMRGDGPLPYNHRIYISIMVFDFFSYGCYLHIERTTELK